MTAFANGTEGEAWMDAWCGTCTKDADKSCPILLELLTFNKSDKVGRGPFYSPQTVAYCTGYEAEPWLK